MIGSDTAPVREAITGDNGILVPFFEPDTLAEKVIEALATPLQFQAIRKEARRTAVNKFDLQRVCLPKAIELIHELADRQAAPRPQRIRNNKPQVVRLKSKAH